MNIRTAIAAVVAMVLLVTLAFERSRQLDSNIAIDYYHFWGIGVARDRVRDDPYAGVKSYSETLNELVERSGSPHLRAANVWRRTIQPTGTPFFYAIVSWQPESFDVGYAEWVALLHAALIAAVYGMARLCGIGRWTAIGTAALVALTFAPFDQDVKAGNVNALQLAFIVGCIAVTTRGLDETRPWLRLAYLPALVLFVVFKPNLVLVATALALQFALTRGQEALARGTILALAVLGLAGVVGPQFFHDGAAWRHWLEYTQGMNGGKLTYSTDEGNMALATMMAGRADGRAVARYALLLGFAMLFVFAAAITSMGKRKSDLRTPLLTLARDPWAAASIAILVTMACSPLLWSHYMLATLVPIFWVIREGSRRRTAAALAVLAYVLLMEPVIAVLRSAGAGALGHSLLMLGWLPLVPAAFLILQAMASRDSPAPITT